MSSMVILGLSYLAPACQIKSLVPRHVTRVHDIFDPGPSHLRQKPGLANHLGRAPCNDYPGISVQTGALIFG
ncbi:uncharacterized protein BO97DRAFT_407263 [Aspergillus homomorphus CBS 101889]|uniref:Uncharacterized protein n=1 Tax=Aspergillus homomorphus (strain CBS 101889) TaxID=1450537 RepID=A0A395HPS9_ASPHC|nr:hypothetical protein BO97DRAFT_407263 [Aspergillus homomorphus CBS 101889]RAL09941.1 hypothetical protein BO97DRAFT_407263 [Aspergillus homomorphus CBS 101889]